MSETLSKMWLEVSVWLVGATWVYMLVVLKSRGPGFSWWDQWTNFGRFWKLMRAESAPALRRKYVGILGFHVMATVSALCAFALYVRSQMP